MTDLNQATASPKLAPSKANGAAKKPAPKPSSKKDGKPKGKPVAKVDGARQTVKAKAPAPAKKAAAVKAKAPAAKATGEWGVQTDSNQERLLVVLKKASGKPVSMSAVLSAVYGKQAKGKDGAIGMVLGGLKAKCQANGHDIVRARDGASKPTLSLVKASSKKATK